MYPGVLPFYMTYPMPFDYKEDNKLLSDLEYLQQMYPTEAKKYQRKIVLFLDKKDYPGSFIYDEYPDRLSLFRIAKEITEEIKKELTDEEKENWEKNREKSEEIVQILLFYEILKRRHGNKHGRLWF